MGLSEIRVVRPSTSGNTQWIAHSGEALRPSDVRRAGLVAPCFDSAIDVIRMPGPSGDCHPHPPGQFQRYPAARRMVARPRGDVTAWQFGSAVKTGLPRQNRRVTNTWMDCQPRDIDEFHGPIHGTEELR